METKKTGLILILTMVGLFLSGTEIFPQQDADQSLQAKALLHIGMCYEKLGMQEAVKAYERLVNNFPAQKNEVALARERLNRLVQMIAVDQKIPLAPKFTQIKIPTKLSRQLALSPDGKRLLLVSDEKLWIMPLSGNLGSDFPGKPEQLNTDGIKVVWAGLSWSGDGKSIAFNELNSPALQDKPEEGKKNKSIYIIPAEGGKPRKIIDNYSTGLATNYKISLSPDGKNWLFLRLKGLSNTYTQYLLMVVNQSCWLIH
ncbi:MAG: tetratricopeptide repeat protein [Bacteroidales bacterium]|nr:tetratricopeptide repeat protein [Bacteroidales bacterium]